MVIFHGEEDLDALYRRMRGPADPSSTDRPVRATEAALGRTHVEIGQE